MTKRGLPVVEIVTTNFLMEAKLVARSRGIPSLPIVVMPNGIELMSRKEIVAAAENACIKIASALINTMRESTP
ncbi:hypothetical protein ACFLVI_00430 [Chloroflexota bacterium]